MSITYTDIFCGAGGSSIGLTAAGLELKLAANHWDRAIETHSANFPDAEHLIADVSNYDMRRLPHTDVGWFSPECTWHSPAGGRKQASKVRAQLDMFDEYVPSAAGVRSRATAFDVIRAAEVHHYKVIIVENVIEFAAWEMFDWWLAGLRQLDYTCQLISVSSAHVGDELNPHAPQWRDRIYVFCTAKGVPVPDVRPRPLAWCPTCDEIVAAVQAWKPNRQVGKYGKQYVYRCPNQACRYAQVEPFVRPAAAAIDWSDLGTRIGDRAKPLAPATMRRIRAGLELFAQPVNVAVYGQTFERDGYVRAWPTGQAPLNARTGTPGDGVAVPPFLLDRREYSGGDAKRLSAVGEPMGTVTAGGRTCRTLVTPPLSVTVNHDGDGRVYPVDDRPLASRTGKIGDGLLVPAGGTWNDDATALHDPMRTRTTRETEAVVTPPQPFITMMRANNYPRSLDEPLAPVTTGRSHGLTTPEPFVTTLRNHASSEPVSDPLATVAAGGNHHALTTPPGAFIQKHHGGLDYGPIGHMTKPVTEPTPSVVARPNLSLVIPYRRGAAKTTREPLHTVATRDSAALVQPAIEVEDCYFRMLQPREHARAQRFPDSYEIKGNRSEQTMQAGNAVSSNVAQWLGGIVASILGRAS